MKPDAAAQLAVSGGTSGSLSTRGARAGSRLGERAHLALTWPLYPALATAAYLTALFANYGAPWPALWRPLVVAVLVTVGIQLVLTFVTRRRHIAAVIVFLGGLWLLRYTELLIALMVSIDVFVLVHWVRRRDLRLPWADVTRLGNVVATVTLAIVAANAAVSGHYWPSGWGSRPAAAPDAPDVYLILLDGHPRLDTLRSEIGVDTTPFVDAMTARGFVESPGAHSNYNLTFLTLASMFNGAQIDQLVPSKPDTGSMVILANLINVSPELDAFHDAGYEIVSVPSPFTHAALMHADRYLDSGNLTDFEINLLGRGEIPNLFPDQERAWLMDDHRDRILTSFDRLHELAAEKTDHPRFVFAHILSPHAPVAFARDGSAVPGLDCFPIDCHFWDVGTEVPGRRRAQAAQITYIDDRIVETVSAIQDQASRPPVIVLFSDHGHRHDMSDRVESLRSFLMASTPGRTGVFPSDASPVNLLTRLSMAYLGTTSELASEEDYYIDVLSFPETGAFAYEPVRR